MSVGVNINPEKEKTKVIFRVFKNGEVIAIFPEELGGCDHWSCGSYMQGGQHGACEPEIISGTDITRPASTKEYASLKAELETLGYDLDIKVKYLYSSEKVRIEKLKNIKY